MEFRSPKTFKSHTTTITTRQDCSAATADVPFDTDSAQRSCKSISLSGTGDDCTELVSGGQQHEESHDDGISHGDAFECRIGIRRSGFHWNRIGPPPAPRVVRVTPTRPGSDFTWVAGYWYPVGNHYKWDAGYWTRLPYASARWMPPHHDGQMFYNGYWEGDKGRIDHDHKWDRDKKRRDSRS
jgi:WXXGXW repeat (2 copies)